MATTTESPQPSILTSDGQDKSIGARLVVPIPTPSYPAAVAARPHPEMSPPTAAGDPMDIAAPNPDAPNTSINKTSPSSTMPGQGPEADLDGKTTDRSKNASPPDTGSSTSNSNTNNSSVNMSAPPPAAAALHQPKIVQTAFIHKLYNMLEDQNIQHLISWSSSADSFVMAPTPDFSKVLSQYFKHTNISSFVRQLNMYGFHKERDVFHTGNPESTLWEFKHGGGNFKRGDLVGLREIKRRASRHALVHRENNYSKQAPSQPGTPAEPVQMNSDGADRLTTLEQSIYDLNTRLQRSEESAQFMHVKNQAAMETMGRLLHFNQELARAMLSLAPPDSLVHRDVLGLRDEMQRQVDALRSMDEGPEPPFSSRQQYFGNLDNAPVSPRQMPQDDSRRGNLTVPQRQNFYRPPVPSNLSVGARRPYGSIGGGSTTQSSPSRNPNPAAPPGPHPLSNVEPHPSSLGRRHTSADIRAHGWQPGMSPFSGNTPTAYPSSPSRVPPEDQRIRDSLSAYSLQTASQQHPSSRPTTPPSFPNNGSNGADTFGNWSWGSAASRGLKDSSLPPTRRGSMAHILNPSDTAERSDEDEEPRGDDDRKRKRVQ